jgi:hypothetical protein
MASIDGAERILQNDWVVLDKAAAAGDVFPPLPPTRARDATIYWLSGTQGGELSAARQDFPGAQAPSRGMRLALLGLPEAPSVAENAAAASTTKGVGTRCLHRDEWVTIWEFYLAPGDRCHYHQHYVPYLYTNLTESLTQELDAQGEIAAAPRRQKINDTTFIKREELGQHAVVNMGESPFLQFIVELKL